MNVSSSFGVPIKYFISALLASVASQATEAVWQPKPAQGPPESRRVLVVKQGMEHNRTHDGHVHGINSHHRYRIDRDPATGLWKIRTAQDDVRRFRDLDVDGDGRADNDAVAAHPWDLSLSNPISMVAPWYDTTIGTQRFSGGIAVYQANIAATGFTEDGMNDTEEGPANQPRRNWTLFRETVDLFSPFRLCAALVWQKPDFLNEGAAGRVSLDDTCTFRLWPGRYFMGIDAMRLLVRNGDQFYLSEHSCRGIGLHVVHPTRTRWTRYDPKAPHDIWLDPARMKFEAVTFDDVTAIGWYVAKDRLVSGYFGCKWEAFEADAIVTAPTQASDMIAMARVKAPGVPAFHMSTCEVPYELWRKIHRVVRAPAHAGFPGFNFDAQGDMGSMDYTIHVDPEHEWTAARDQPVTDIPLHDMLAWCNALSAYESRTPCYYEDAAFTKVYREVITSPIYGPRRTPTIHVNWAADGFRLPTPAEWSAAGGGGATAARDKATRPVGQGSANANGIHDLAGNVWEPVWTFGDKLDPAKLNAWTVAGGSFLSPAAPESISANPHGDDAFRGRFDIGLRVVRREPGLPRPPMGIIVDVPTWTIRQGARTAVVPARQWSIPVREPIVATSPIPGRSYALGTHEVTFAQYRRVYEWAETHGYDFDHDGEMGSMAYWGFGDDWRSGTRRGDEPVTGVSHNDVLLWLNALSELEGRRPVYHADPGCTQVLRKTVHYRPDMAMHAATASEAERARKSLEVLFTPFHCRGDADGYRLPSWEEFRHAAFAGVRGKFPWGDDPAGGAESAWLADWSGFHTHPVGRKQPNAFGLYDMIGNVAELAQEATGPDEGMSGGYSFRLGGSFLDVTDHFDTVLRLPRLVAKGAPSQSRGLVYPDVGFRVLRQLAGPGESAGVRPAGAAPAGNAAVRPGGRPERPGRSTGRSTAATPATFDPLQGKVHRANLGRTGEHQTTGVPQLRGIKWTHETGGPVRSSPVVVDGTLFVGSYDGHIHAVDAATGAGKWRVETGGPVSGSAAVVGGTVYIASEAGRLCALRAADGKLLWHAETGGKTAGSPAVIGNAVYIGGGHPRGGGTVLSMSARPLLAFDAATGTALWTGANGPQGHAAIATDGLRLYAGVGASNYGAFTLADGQLAWTYNSGHQRRQFASLTIVGDAVFVPVAIGGFVARLDAATGRQVWINGAHEPNLSHPMNHGGEFGHETFTDVAVAGGRVFASFNDGQVIAYDAATGKKVWSVRCGPAVQSSPSVAAGVVYVGSWDEHLYALDAQNGAVRWKQRLGGKVNSSPWPADGVVYVGCDDGKIYAVQ